MIFAGITVNRAALVAILSVILTSWLTKDHRINPKRLFEAFVEGAKTTCGIGAMCAMAGALIVTINMTGVGLRFSSIVIGWAGQNVLLIGLCVAFLGLLLGMGLPAAAGYIIVMSIATPALIKLGVPALTAHLFVYYFAMNNSITPPIGVSYYTAAAIADAPAQITGFKSLLLGIGSYTIPFFFLQNPLFLMDGEPWRILIAFVTGVFAMVLIAMSIQGVSFLGDKLSIVPRVLLLVGFYLLLEQGLMTDLYGLIVALIALAYPRFRKILFRRKPDPVGNGL